MQHDRFGSQISVKLVCLSIAHIQRLYPLPIEHPILENEALVARNLTTGDYSCTGSTTLLLRCLLYARNSSIPLSNSQRRAISYT
jgi:hypothetical protein